MLKHSVPLQDREWLRQLRLLKGLIISQAAKRCGLSHLTYMSAEGGIKYKARNCSVKTLNSIATAFGLKLDLFYFRTDAEGRLIDKSSITDIIALFSISGYRTIILTETMVRTIFAPPVADFIISDILVHEV